MEAGVHRHSAERREPGGTGTTAVADLAQTLPAEILRNQQRHVIWSVVLAGGIGSRFWPLSSASRPKQLLPLVDDRPLIADTIRRLDPLIPPDRVLVMTSRDIADSIHAAIPQIPVQNMLAEPAPMGTAASLARGVGEVIRRYSSDAIVCVTHADLAISFEQLFHDSITRAAAAAVERDTLVLLGVPPTRVDTSFGYIATDGRTDSVAEGERGRRGAGELKRVSTFVEKPSYTIAAAMRTHGALWHSGIFVGRAGAIEKELRRWTPEVAPLLNVASDEALRDLAPSIPSLALERGLLERSASLSVLPVDFNWDDVGTWASLRRARELDDQGNGVHGGAHVVDSAANIVHAEGGKCILYGVDNLLVVRLHNITFVTTIDKARDLRGLIDSLPESLRTGAGTSP